MRSCPVVDRCTFPGCVNAIWVKQLGLCSSHYTQVNRGKPLTALRTYKPIMSIIARARPQGDCLILETETDRDDKRKRLSYQGHTWLAHRLSFVLSGRHLPNGSVVHHICATETCINPEHLQLADQADNNLEMLARRTYEARIRSLEARVAELEGLLGLKC